MYLFKVPNVSSPYFNKMKRMSHSGKIARLIARNPFKGKRPGNDHSESMMALPIVQVFHNAGADQGFPERGSYV